MVLLYFNCSCTQTLFLSVFWTADTYAEPPVTDLEFHILLTQTMLLSNPDYTSTIIFSQPCVVVNMQNTEFQKTLKSRVLHEGAIIMFLANDRDLLYFSCNNYKARKSVVVFIFSNLCQAQIFHMQFSMKIISFFLSLTLCQSSALMHVMLWANKQCRLESGKINRVWTVH